MKWAIIYSTAKDACPVPEIFPMVDGDLQPGHRSSPSCPCLPCLVDPEVEWRNAVLVHHLLVDGKPVQADEPNSHDCGLRRQP